ncbi:MAG: ABC transporter permease [Phycisphaerae bacterium]|nr:ABC transporter permease [Phycisphaerae bacterium]
MGTFWQDLRYGIRMLGKNPGFTVMVVSSLALGVTLNSAIFSLVDGLWLRSMSFADPGRVVRIFGSTPQRKEGDLSFPDYLDLGEQMRTVSGLATSDRHGAVLVSGDEPEDLRADVVSRNFFSVLGIQPHLGRFFSEADEPALQDTPTVVLSHRLWQRRFGRDPNLVGESIVLSGRSPVVLAVTPPGFNGLERLNPAEVWYPVENYGIDTARDERFLSVVGRLKPGYTVAQAQSEAETIFRRLDLQDSASHTPLRALVQTEAEIQFQRTGTLGLLLLGIVGTVLLLACANVSSLLLARAEVRAREMAVRSALGGSRWRLVRQLLAESLLLALTATAVSLLLARWLVSAWPALLPPDAAGPIALVVHFDGRVLTFTAAMSFLTVFLFGLAPAVHASKPDLVPALKGDLGTGGQGARHRGLSALVIGQASLALVLMATATLLVRSVLACYTADIGFERKEILLVELGTGNEEQGQTFHRQLKERALALPGVKRASVARVVPFSSWGTGASRKVFLPGNPASVQEDGWSVRFNAVDQDYFKLLGIPILRGRDFNARDDKSGAPVMLINESMAKRFWPKEDPVGQLVRLGSPTGEAVRITGVVQDTKIVAIDEAPQPYLFLPLAQHYHHETILLVESAVDAATLAGPVRAELSALGAKPAQSDFSTMKEYIRARFVGQVFLTKLVVTFGLLGLGLAAVGLYGVVAYTVNRRTREIGIRMALGAQRREVLTLVLRRGMALATLGAGLGLPIALAIGHTVRGFLYGVSPLDPLSITVSLVVVLAVALLACYIPARRAARLDPIRVLRYE